MSDHPSAWKPLIDEWVTRERQLHSAAPIQEASVRVRDSVEIEDQAFVLLSYELDTPWPAEEDAPGDSRTANTAVLQAVRVRQPWIERDATRALSELHSIDGTLRVNEHLLGTRRAFSGQCAGSELTAVTLHFADGHSQEATVVDGWFLAIVPEAWRLERLSAQRGGESWDTELVRDDISEILAAGPEIGRSASQSIYFSPLDLRTVLPLVQWQRAGELVVVASCLEQYDNGGILRLRIDGVRADDDLFVTWPTISLAAGGSTLLSAISGEYGMKDTLAVDVAFKPWIADAAELVVRVSDLRGADGPAAPIEMTLAVKS